jgi:ABC-type uncharacterized transport system involved in gliding motility auxiliary subunit
LTKFGDAPDTLADLIAPWGITLTNDFVVDPNVNPPSVAVSDPLAYGQHPITQSLRGVTFLFPTSRSIKVGEAPQGVTLTPLVLTNSNAWGETDFSSIDQNKVAFDATTDVPGPITLAVAAENATTHGRLVVFGDSEFPADVLYQRGNGDLLVNTIDWAAEQENLISLTPKQSTPRTFNPPATLGLVGMIVTSLCVIPLLVITGGVAAWLSRRRRG